MTTENTGTTDQELDSSVLLHIEDRGLAGLWKWDIGTDRFEGTSGVSRILGLSANAFGGMAAIEGLVHPDDRVDLSDLYRNARDGLYDFRAMRIIRPNGDLRWVSLRSSVQYDRNGEPKSVIGLLIDESDHATRRRSTQTAELRSTVLDQIDGISFWHADHGGLIKDMSNWKTLTGQENRKSTGIGWLSQVPVHERARVAARWSEAITNAKPFEMVHHLETIDGVTRLVQTRGLMATGRHGAARDWIGVTVVLPQAIKDVQDGSDPSISVSPLTPGHFRAARGFLGWTAQKLADMSGISLSTVRRLEDPATHQMVQDNAVAAARAALERNGIAFWIVPSGACAISLRDQAIQIDDIV